MIYDYIIIGAGVIGSSTAYYLKKLKPNLKILLIDKNHRPGFGNTAKSAALFRNLFSSDTSRQLAESSIKFYYTISKKIQLNRSGYLWLFSEDQWDKNKTTIDNLIIEDLDIGIKNQVDIKKVLDINLKSEDKFPDVKMGIYCRNCGSLSAIALAEYYANSFVESGGKTLFNTEIKSMNLTGEKNSYAPWDDINIKNIIDYKGNVYSAKNYVFATGAWTNNLLSKIGVASSIYPKKRQLFGLKINDKSNIFISKENNYPAIILPAGGVYIKPIMKNNMLIVGCADDLGQPYILSDFNAKSEYFNKAIKPVLSHYFPILKNYNLSLKWAGYYAYHWPDKNPVIETVSNITWISGTSGSGIMKADAIGRIASSKLIGYDYADLFDQSKFKISDISLYKRNVQLEKLII